MTNLFKVEGQTLTPVEIYPAVSDTVNYLTFAFMFSYDWAGLTKSAIFTKGTDVYEVVLTDDQVLESDHVNLTAGTWSISVVGDTVIDAVVTRQITTSSYEYTVEQSGATSGGVFPPSVASQVYVNVNQATPQTFVGGIPKLAADRVIDQDNEITDKKFVVDTVATVTADDFNHNDLSNKQGGAAGEYYHTTQAQNAALHAHSNKTALDAVSGTNTGDQDLSGLELKSNKVTSMTGASTDVQYPSAKSVYNSTMRLLISRTIGAGENVSAITWTQDDAGNALALKDIDIRIRVPSNSVSAGSSAYIYTRFNDVSSSGQYVQSSALANALYASIFRSTFGLGILSLKENCGYLSGYVSFSNYDGTTVGNGAIASGTVFAVSSITKVYLFISGSTFIPAGTVIEIYGRTA